MLRNLLPTKQKKVGCTLRDNKKTCRFKTTFKNMLFYLSLTADTPYLI